MRKFLNLSALFAVVLVGVNVVTLPSALSQEAKPSQSTETYGNWTVRCVTSDNEAKVKTCEIIQLIRNDNGATIVQTAIGKGSGDASDGLIVVFQLPQGLLLTEPAKMTLEGTETVLSARYFTCMQSTCLARADIKYEDLDPFIAAKKGILDITQRDGRTLRIEISYDGLSDALERLKVL